MLEQSSFLKVLRGEPSRRVPVWFMRQAGRYLPEYREIRARHSMLDVIRTPELAAKVTLQPLDRFDLDAAIIFADILNPLIGMGMKLDFVEKEGPKIFNPIRGHDDVRALTVPSAEENVGYTLEAIRLCVANLSPRGIPLIGFAGAPFTLASYMIEGGGSQALPELKRFILREPAAWALLMEKLVSLLSDYLVAQARAGASALQLFDSWAGVLGPAQFAEIVVPVVRSIFERVRAETNVPLIYFAPSTTGVLDQIGALPVDAVGVDWRVDLSRAASWCGGKVLQGNLDPVLLTASWEATEKAAMRVLAERSAIGARHIFNVGHGLLPQTEIAQLERLVSLIRSNES